MICLLIDERLERDASRAESPLPFRRTGFNSRQPLRESRKILYKFEKQSWMALDVAPFGEKDADEAVEVSARSAVAREEGMCAGVEKFEA
ncbi:uncharacterized protein RCC_08042 [Ramularia collo-cygni]|uniref:Uncharacterized protein n=1 Tax=Ramularia collo-cygni TaxID=112498 RepID=A0A2D3VLN5_9PEZI|nr:uncharacterized protein RCC_08042 [Ramularia collo-cygni]CZT22173.1 uncharacterized protein RCC_08042 [Ramularia collo-cygni]